MEPASCAVCLLCRSHGTTYFGLVLPTKSAEEGTGIATPGMCFFFVVQCLLVSSGCGVRAGAKLFAFRALAIY